jgi:hypothetical protein
MNILYDGRILPILKIHGFPFLISPILTTSYLPISIVDTPEPHAHIHLISNATYIHYSLFLLTILLLYRSCRRCPPRCSLLPLPAHALLLPSRPQILALFRLHLLTPWNICLATWNSQI